jgi:hypothetical protein
MPMPQRSRAGYSLSKRSLRMVAITGHVCLVEIGHETHSILGMRSEVLLDARAETLSIQPLL